MKSANLLLFLFSRILHLPPEYNTVPPTTQCRVFRTALSQEDCGACAAFAVSTFVAMHTCLDNNEDFVPSPYRIFDCANGTCDQGVSFGHALSAVQYGVEDLGDSEPVYGMQCNLRWERRTRQTARLTHVISDQLQIKTAVAFFGPLLGSMSHLIYRDPDTRAYRLIDDNASAAKLHAVVVVGWDTEGNWIVQNSWGEKWGDGFGRGRIAPNILAFAFDPSIRMCIRVCYACLSLCCVCSVSFASKRQRRFYIGAYIALFVLFIMPSVIFNWEDEIL